MHVFSGPDSHPELVAIKVGSLDDRSAFKVQADIWMKSAPPWHRPHEGARQIEGPKSRLTTAFGPTLHRALERRAPKHPT